MKTSPVPQPRLSADECSTKLVPLPGGDPRKGGTAEPRARARARLLRPLMPRLAQPCVIPAVPDLTRWKFFLCTDV